ncbi:MAG: 3'-5' exonuclease [Bacteroidales bacterium]|nr:3'-5' exonuclease [Bacteroidales bacterium]
MKLNLKKPLCFLDLETTGINIGRDKIIEICLVKISPDGSEEILEQRINPEIPIPLNVSEIHGIFDADVKDQPTFKEVAPKLLQFIGDADFSGFNALRFDIPLLAEEFLRAEVDFDLRDKKVVDVQNIFHKMEPRTLKAAYKFYCNKNLENAHSALADTQATIEILRAQVERYENTEIENSDNVLYKPVKNNVDALASFSQQQACADLAGHIGYNEIGEEIFNFGKHKGRTVEEVFRIEPPYYEWMMRSDFPLYTKKIITGIKLRNFRK